VTLNSLSDSMNKGELSQVPAQAPTQAPTELTTQTHWHGVSNEHAFQQVVVELILISALRAIQQRGQFLIVLAGGNTPREIYKELCKAQTDWSAWQIYFSDERCLPSNDSARNSRMAAEVWLDHIPIPLINLHPMPMEMGVIQAAKNYAESLHGIGDFDLVLLGLGEDGHTASLFPNHEWGAEAHAPDTLVVCDAPKPPSERVSLSAARLSRARQVIFLVSGESKRNAVDAWRDGKAIPASAINPIAGVDVFVEDKLLVPALTVKGI